VRVNACVCVSEGLGARAKKVFRACSLTYLACKTRVTCYNFICGISVSTIYLHVITYTARVSEKKLLNVGCVFLFSPEVLSETFLIPRRIQRDIDINVKTSLCKVPGIFVGF
jgi:hypothetical protein